MAGNPNLQPLVSLDEEECEGASFQQTHEENSDRHTWVEEDTERLIEHHSEDIEDQAEPSEPNDVVADELTTLSH